MVVLGSLGCPVGIHTRPPRPHQAAATHPAPVETTPSTASRARLTAAASRAKSAPILVVPRTRDRRPPCRRRIRCPILRSPLRAGGPVVGEPTRIPLPCPGRGQRALLDADADRSPGPGRRALLSQRTPRAQPAERGGAGAVPVADDRRGVPGRAADRVG